MEKLREKLRVIIEETSLWNQDKAKHFLSFAFNHLRDRSDSRSVDVITAAHGLHCIMKGRSPFTDSFCHFLVRNHEKIRVLHMDQWKIFFDFTRAFPSVELVLSRFDSNDAWPSIYDDYVEWLMRNEMRSF